MFASIGILIAGLLAFFGAHQTAGAVSVVGTSLQDVRLLDVSGNTHPLNEYRGKVLVLALWSFKCPVSISSDRRLNELQLQYANRGVVVLAIDPNSDETPEAIGKNAANLNLGYPAMLDPDGALTEKLSATHIPTIYLLDKNLVIQYAGAFDNNRRPGDRDREAYVQWALDAILAGKQVTIQQTKPFGCSIRRRSP